MIKLLRKSFLLLSAVLVSCLCPHSAQAQCSASVTITSPGNNASYTYSGSGASFNITTSFSSGCTTKPRTMDYLLNGGVQCEINDGANQSVCPVSGLSVGSYSLSVQTYQPSATSNTVTVNVVPPSPSVSLSLNSSSYTTPTSVVMNASASDNGYGYISYIQFYVDGTLLSTSYNNPASFSWTSPTQGNHTFTAVTQNGYTGATATSSGVSVPVYTPPAFVAYDNQCPSKL